MNFNTNNERLRIIKILRREIGKSFFEISRTTKMPIEKVFELYDDMKKSNALDDLESEMFVDFHSNNFLNVFFIFAPVTNHHKIIEYLKNNINVRSVFLTDREFIVYTSFITLLDYDCFIDSLEELGVLEIEDYFIKEIVI